VESKLLFLFKTTVVRTSYHTQNILRLSLYANSRSPFNAENDFLQKSAITKASFFFVYLDWLGPVTCPHSELIMKLWILQTVGITPWTRDQPEARPLSAQDNTNIKQTQTYTHCVGFEPMIPVFELAKTFLALDSAATVTGTEPALYGVIWVY
jgi:hypothetical protein